MLFFHFWRPCTSSHELATAALHGTSVGIAQCGIDPDGFVTFVNVAMVPTSKDQGVVTYTSSVGGVETCYSLRMAPSCDTDSSP